MKRLNQWWPSIIIFCTTAVLFIIEGLIHFNIGKNESKITLPSWKEFGHIVLTVVSFSFLNSVAVWGITRIYKNRKS